MQIDDIRFLQNQNTVSKEPGVRTNVSSREANSPGAYDVMLGSVRPVSTSPIYQKNTNDDEKAIDAISDKEAHFTDANTMKKQLSMSAAGFSTEDFDKAKEDGFDLKEEDADSIITITDQIKMKLLEAGKDISVMGGLSSEEIAALSGGNAALAATMEKALAAADFPVDEAVLSDAVTAVRKASELSQPTERVINNLLRQNDEPTIENVYAATFSQGTDAGDAPKEKFSEEVYESLLPQIEKIITEAELPMDQRQLDNARVLLEEQIPLTPENFQYVNELQTKEMQLEPEEVVTAITDAVGEGRMPQDAYLLPGYSLHDKATEAVNVIANASDAAVAEIVNANRPLTIEALAKEQVSLNAAGESKVEKEGTIVSDVSTPAAIHAMRVMEEARLVMTKEANFHLLKRGIAIDTSELETVVEQLKEQESLYYKNILGENETQTLEEKINLFERTNETVTEVMDMPAALLGRIPEAAELSLSRMHEEGQSLKARFEAAGERYETMRTQIRADLGDRIQKAFSHMEGLFDELNLEQTDSNERAVRILAYNELEITQENVASMRHVDEQVQRVFKNLTPGVVAKMIKEADNPLDLSLEELNEKIESIKAVSSASSAEEGFAQFLWKADQAGTLTEEERAGIMGVYRLIYQVEKTDGAVIGQLLHEGADVTLRNMMGAVRTRKHENREYTVDDNFGFGEFKRESLSITEQIEMAFQTDRMRDAADVITPEKMLKFENEEAYLSLSPDRFAAALEQMEESEADQQLSEELKQQQLTDIKEAIDSEARIYDILQRFDLPQSPAHLEAFTQLLSDRNAMYRKLFTNDRRVFGDEEEIAAGKDISDVMEDVMHAFGEAIKTPEDMAKAQRKLEDIATTVMQDMLVEQRVGSMDVRGMQIAIKQIKAIGQMGRHSETYAIPITVADETGNLSLKIVRGKEEDRGLVDVALKTEKLGNIYASFRYEAEGITGTVHADRTVTRELLLSHADDLREKISGTVDMPVKVTVLFDGRTDANAIFDETKTEFEQTRERKEVQTRMLYGIARSAIDAFEMM